MGSTLRLVAVGLFVSVFAGSPASAGESLSYHELRADHPQVEAAVAAMPSSGLNGALARVSALLAQPGVQALPEGSSELLPRQFERQMVRAIESVAERLEGLDDTPIEARYTILQVVSVQVFARNQELYSDADWSWCDPRDAGCDNPPVLEALDALAQQLIPHLHAIIFDYQELAAGDPSYPAVVIYADRLYNSQTFGERIEELQSTWGYAHGEPIIDP